MTTKKLITSNDPKGLDATAKWHGVYNKAKLTDGADGSAQHLNESKEFWKELAVLIQKHSATNQFANEVVSSKYTYPSEFKPRPIGEQVEMIAKNFGLDGTQAYEFIKTLPTLPEGSEEWFAIPKISAIRKINFPTITDPATLYCEAVKMVLGKLAEHRSFKNYREGQITPNRLRQHSRTAEFLAQLEAEQPGDIIIIAVQHGMKHRGESVRRARETFASNEFGLGSFALGCMTLVHPERYVRWEELDTDCAGDEFSPDADGSFSECPRFRFGACRLEFDANVVSLAYDFFGSASAFLPQAI